MAVYRTYKFGQFQLVPRDRLLYGEKGSKVRISGKPLDLLVYLLDHAGKEIDTDFLCKGAWSNCALSNQALTKHFQKLYALLNDTDRNHPVYILRDDRSTRFLKEPVIAEEQERSAPEADPKPSHARAAIIVVAVGVCISFITLYAWRAWRGQLQEKDVIVMNNINWSGPFMVEKVVADRFKFTPVYDVSNISDSPISLLDFHLEWRSFTKRTDTWILPETESGPRFIDVYDDMSALESAQCDDRTSGKRAEGAHCHEYYPISIPPHTTRHLRFLFIVQLFQHGAVVPFGTDDDAYKKLMDVLGFEKLTEAIETRNIPVWITLSDDRMSRLDVTTLIFLPGSYVYLPKRVIPQ